MWPANLLCNTHPLQYVLVSNEDTYLKIHYDMDTLPEDRATLPKFNSDVCKWHLFISNITEDVFHVLQDTFISIILVSSSFKCIPNNKNCSLLTLPLHFFQPLLLTIH